MFSGKRVLFVDDEPSIRLTLPPVLQQHGFEVRSAATVNDALDEINSCRFDVLLSDLNISIEGDGVRVVKAMRHLQPPCVTVILTGHPEFGSAEDIEVDDYMVKPADVDSLVSLLRKKLLENKRN